MCIMQEQSSAEAVAYLVRQLHGVDLGSLGTTAQQAPFTSQSLKQVTSLDLSKTSAFKFESEREKLYVALPVLSMLRLFRTSSSQTVSLSEAKTLANSLPQLQKLQVQLTPSASVELCTAQLPCSLVVPCRVDSCAVLSTNVQETTACPCTLLLAQRAVMYSRADAALPDCHWSAESHVVVWR